ncbi:hypothetical protein RvY_19008 [Ramazzottius varieornatus]|uniref:Uncharacterized protein n=1 Tax=Ramazzottius varieornatus TaxID=947166 RepID=A0A1D1WBZ3_RAMVA|nr:hypothetical protein RvY_19008 [Ramazzottius varieornatus]
MRNQQDMIQKLEAAAKLLNKMLHDDRRHRAFLQERLDTAEQSLYLRTCLSNIQHPPKHHRRKPTTSISQDCSMVSTQTEARTDDHNKDEKPDGTEPMREPSTIDSPEADQRNDPPENPTESAYQLPQPPFNLRGFGKERRSARKTLSFSDSVSWRIPDSSIRQDSLYDHDPHLEDVEDLDSTLSESGTLTDNPSRYAKPRKVADLEHPNAAPVPGINPPMRKQRRNNLLGPTATSDDGDSGEFDSRQSPLFAGNKDLHRLTYRMPAQKPVAPATKVLESKADKERRKPPENVTDTTLGRLGSLKDLGGTRAGRRYEEGPRIKLVCEKRNLQEVGVHIAKSAGDIPAQVRRKDSATRENEWLSRVEKPAARPNRSSVRHPNRQQCSTEKAIVESAGNCLLLNVETRSADRQGSRGACRQG